MFLRNYFGANKMNHSGKISLRRISFAIFCFIILFLLSFNVKAFDFDTSKEDYKANFFSAEDSVKLSDGKFEKNLEILRVTRDNVLVKQDSGEIFLINFNESKEVDLDSDGFGDVKISFNSYDNGKAELALSKLKLPDESIDGLNNPGVNEENKLKKFTYYLLGFVILLLALYLIKKLLKVLIRKFRKYY